MTPFHLALSVMVIIHLTWALACHRYTTVAVGFFQWPRRIRPWTCPDWESLSVSLHLWEIGHFQWMKQNLESTSCILICGGPVNKSVVHAQTDLEMVTLHIHPSSINISTFVPRLPLAKVNGHCTVIHTGAFPRYCYNRMMANSPAADVIVPLGRGYLYSLKLIEQAGRTWLLTIRTLL